ncbi:hypothetical protein [Stieleria mannarensis]|uniref:hypothetical protein n=1 Tax=Stieleria mannarensis TaxID=2755585 RepID=UPI001600324E|nr:hypothetical protein [Rhodopirellula sp. JC639]
MHRQTLLVVTGLMLTIGCSKSGSENATSQTPEAQQATFETPDAVTKAFAEAAKNNDWKSAIEMITPESQEMIVTGMVMQASFMTMEDEAKGKELKALMERHGLDEASMSDEGPGIGEEPDVNRLVDDLPAFVADLAAWIAKHDTDSSNPFASIGDVTDVKIDGDAATGKLATEMGKQPVEFRKIDGGWKLHLAMGPPPEPSLDDLGIDFRDTGDGDIGMMKLGDKSSGLNHAFAYNGVFFDQPCIVLVLSAQEVSAEEKSELETQLKDDAENAFFFPTGPNVTLTLTPDGSLMSMNVWIDNSSLSVNRGPAVDVDIDGKMIRGRVGMSSKEFNDQELSFHAEFETEIHF